MYATSAAMAALIDDPVRYHWQSRLSYNGTPIDADIKSIRLVGGSNGSGEFELGGVVSQYIDVVMSPPAGVQVENRELLWEVGLDVAGTTEWIPMGYFTAQKPDRAEDQISFTAFDRMIKFEKNFGSALSDPTTTIAVLEKLAESTGVSISTSGLASYSMDRPIGYTAREVLCYVAQLYGGFAVCDRAGVIRIGFYESSGLTIRPDRYWSAFEHSDLNFALDSVVVVAGEDDEGEPIEYTAGSGARRITFSNPFFTQEALNRIWSSRLQDLSYMPGSIRSLGDPRIDPWDRVIIRDRNNTPYQVPVMQLEQTYDGGITTQITAVGKAESEQSIDYKGPTTKEMNRYHMDLALIDHAIVDKLDAAEADIIYAKIDDLEVTEGRIDDLTVRTAAIEDLEAENLHALRADVDDLSADKADVTYLEAALAQISVLLGGNGHFDELEAVHLIAGHAAIDTSVVISSLEQNTIANNLIAGRILTDQVTIGSQRGDVLLSGGTMTFKDSENHVRLQIGRDANNNFTFVLYDATGQGQLIDSTGIHASAIGDGLITNDMIKGPAPGETMPEDQKIDASKINIESIISRVNGATTMIKSNQIYFDDEHQSLTQIYTQLSNSTSIARDNAATALNQATEAKALAGDVLDALVGIDTLAGFLVLLSNEAHTVHTLTDGSNGDYTDCMTQIYAYLGDTDVTDHTGFTVIPSAGVTGTWDSINKIYQVTNLTTDNGYVDFQCSYGHNYVYLCTRSGANLLTRNENRLVMPSGAAVVTRRFSISKARDGRVGTFYRLQASVLVMRKDSSDFTPDHIDFSAVISDTTSMRPYEGRFKIEESTDGYNFTTKYQSSGAETAVSYTPTSLGVTLIRCTLYDGTGASLLDTQTVATMTDAEGILDDFGAIQDAWATAQATIADYTTAVDGFNAQLEQTRSDIRGVTDNTLLFQTPYTEAANGWITITARVYKNGQDVADQYPARWFTWKIKTESGTIPAPRSYWGRSTQIRDKSILGLGGVVIGRFATYNVSYLTTRNENILCTREGNKLTIWTPA